RARAIFAGGLERGGPADVSGRAPGTDYPVPWRWRVPRCASTLAGGARAPARYRGRAYRVYLSREPNAGTPRVPGEHATSRPAGINTRAPDAGLSPRRWEPHQGRTPPRSASCHIIPPYAGHGLDARRPGRCPYHDSGSQRVAWAHAARLGRHRRYDALEYLTAPGGLAQRGGYRSTPERGSFALCPRNAPMTRCHHGDGRML